MNQDMFLWKAPNKDGPTLQQFEAIIAKYPSAAGMGMVDGGELTSDVQMPPKAASMVATCKMFKDVGVIFHFMNYPEGFKTEDRQPITVLKDDGVCIAIAYIHGQFPTFIKDNGHSPHYNFAINNLTPMMAELWMDCGKNLDKLKKTLELPFVQRGIKAAMVTGHVAFQFNDGDIVSIDKEAVPIRTDYGWTTDNVPTIAAEAKETKPPMKNKAGFVRAVPAPDPAPELVEPPELEEPEEAPDPTKIAETVDEETARQIAAQLKRDNTKASETAIAAQLHKLPAHCEVRNGNEVWFVPPNNMHGNQLKKQGYGATAGFLPDGRSVDEYGNVYGRPAVRLQSKKMKGINLIALVGLGKPADKPVDKPAAPVTSAKPANTAGDMVIAPEVIEKIAAHLKQPKVLRILDEFAKQTVSPTWLQEITKKQPNFGESNGLDLVKDTAKWTVPFIEEAIKDPHALAVFAASWKLEALKLMSAEQLAAINKVPVVPDKKDQQTPVQRRTAGFAAA